MYLGVDVGGTKTLVAVLDEHGVIKEETKFPTPATYAHWLLEVKHALAHFNQKEFKAGVVAIPATEIDREHGRGISFGNLDWRNVPIQADIERAARCPIAVENDAKLAALSEAMMLKGKYHKLVYVTVSTGIGYGLVVDGAIDTSIGDAGGRSMLLEHRGKHVPWEEFASGKAIVRRYGKKAMDITDEETWQKISRDLAQGFIELIAVMQPDVMVIGGSVGEYFDRYGDLLLDEIKKYDLPLTTLPELREAARPNQAVVYGCYDLAKQRFSHAKATH